jgi:hypothetical protein
MTFLKKRLPQWQEVVQVLGTTVFLVFGKSLYNFFYRFPSFIFSHSLGAIVGILSYMLSFALLESLLVVALMIILCVILPQKWLNNGFAYKGSLAVLVLALAMIRLDHLANDEIPNLDVLYHGFARRTLAALVSVLLLVFIPPLRKLLKEIVERMQIFAYVYVTLGIIGLVIIIFRNLW